MAEEKKPYSDKVLKQQKKINDEGQLLVNILKSQLAAQKKISQELGKQNKDRDEAKADEAFILKASREGIKLAKKLADFSRTDLQNKAKRKSFDIAQQNALNEIKILEAKAAEAAEAGLHKREELLLNQVDSTKQAVEASKELTKEYKSLDFAKGFLGGMENLVKDIPVINKLFGGLTKSVNAAGDEYEKSGNERQARLKGYMTFGKELAKLSLGALLAALVAGFVALDKSTVQLTRNLGLGSRSAKKRPVKMTRKPIPPRIAPNKKQVPEKELKQQLNKRMPNLPETFKQAQARELTILPPTFKEKHLQTKTLKQDDNFAM